MYPGRRGQYAGAEVASRKWRQAMLCNRIPIAVLVELGRNCICAEILSVALAVVDA